MAALRWNLHQAKAAGSYSMFYWSGLPSKCSYQTPDTVAQPPSEGPQTPDDGTQSPSDGQSAAPPDAVTTVERVATEDVLSSVDAEGDEGDDQTLRGGDMVPGAPE